VSSSYDLNRRDFAKIVLTFLGSIMGIVLGLPAIGYLISPATKVQKSESWIPAGSLENYPLSVPTLFSFTRTTKNGWDKTVNSYGVYVLRSSEDQVKVYSNMCTHLSCRVTWKDDLHEFICPCHDGHFDIDGKVLKGPPPAPLVVYQTKIEDGSLLIHFAEGGHV
jgi:menaquinol-cytochrome c reductase iron-sulfur subunit